MKNEVIKFERIRNLRVDRDITQSDIAELLNVKQNTYSQYELGIINYPIDVLIKLADIHDTSIDYLLGLTDEKQPYPRNQK